MYSPLERLRWSRQGQKTGHRAWRVVTALVILNFVLGNFWLHRGVTARADLTEGRDYTISQATRDLIGQLQEPLLIRGYFSARTHPVLAPLVPRIRDTIREIESISGGRVRAEFVDPREEPDLEEEANQRYNIRPIPFRTADRYQTSLVNSYFDLLLQYGDKHEVLRFTDLIEMKAGRTGTDVRLRNLEYDLARSIKKVLYGFQGIGALFAGIDRPVDFRGYISSEEKLPKSIALFRSQLMATLKELRKESGGKFKYEIIDPEAKGAAVAKQLAEQYGFRPMAAGPFDPKRFYFYMVMKNNGTTVQVPMPGKLSQEAARRSVEAALRRFAPGFIKTIGFHSPPPEPQQPGTRPRPPDRQFRFLAQKLRQNYRIAEVDLKSGLVPENVDLLLLAAPQGTDAEAAVCGGSVSHEGRLRGLVDVALHRGAHPGRSGRQPVHLRSGAAAGALRPDRPEDSGAGSTERAIPGIREPQGGHFHGPRARARAVSLFRRCQERGPQPGQSDYRQTAPVDHELGFAVDASRR